MSSSFFHPRRVLVVAALAAAVSVTGCSDATDPSVADGTGLKAPATHAPAATSTPADAGSQLPTLDKAPAELKLPAPGETAKAAAGISFLRTTTSWHDPRYSDAPGIVVIPAGSAKCGSALGIRYVTVGGIKASVSGPLDQVVTEEVWLYRWNGTSWVFVNGVRVDTKVFSFSAIEDAWFDLTSGGHYRVVVRYTWFANGGAGWVPTAQQTYDFDGQAEYTVSTGGFTGVGYCKIN
jgi:hypothetical protein